MITKDELESKYAWIKGQTEDPKQRNFLYNLATMDLPRGVKYDFRDMSQDSDVVGRVQIYLEKIRNRVALGNGLFLYGAPGVGKTRVICHIMRHSAKHGLNGAYFTALGLGYEMKKAIGIPDRLSDVEDSTLYRDILVIDEMGKENPDSAWYRSELERIVKFRGDNGGSMIFGTNLRWDEWKNTYGEALSEYVESNCFKLQFFCGNYRMKKLVEFEMIMCGEKKG